MDERLKQINLPQILNNLHNMPEVKHPVYNVAAENYASKFYKTIIDRINKFEGQLDDQHEIGIKLVTFGQSITISVTEIGYSNPSIIIFRGLTENNEQIELIQHVTQLSFLLLTMKRINTDIPKRKIGFINTSSQEP